MNLRVTRTYAGGRGGGRFGGFSGGGRGGPFGGGSTEHRYNRTLSVSARNILNHANDSAPVGFLGSTNFMLYTAINGGYGAEQTPTGNRRIDIQLRLQF